MPPKAPKRKAAKVAAAVDETSPEAKSIKWRGHAFALPKKLPESFVFRLTQIEEAGKDVRPTLKLLASLLNAEDASQYGVVIREIENAEDEEAAVVEAYELVNQIFEMYGTTEGESEASQDS